MRDIKTNVQDRSREDFTFHGNYGIIRTQTSMAAMFQFQPVQKSLLENTQSHILESSARKQR